MLFCTKCGKSIAVDAAFCSGCGIEVFRHRSAKQPTCQASDSFRTSSSTDRTGRFAISSKVKKAIRPSAANVSPPQILKYILRKPIELFVLCVGAPLEFVFSNLQRFSRSTKSEEGTRTVNIGARTRIVIGTLTALVLIVFGIALVTPDHGHLQQARSSHTATLLQNGKILIAGGNLGPSDHFKALDTAELFDPASGTSEDAASMSNAIENHSAVILKDGKVLCSGGAGLDTHYIQLYDPSSDTFTSVVDPIGEINQRSALLPNGKVLLAMPSSAELFNPGDNSIEETGDPTVNRRGSEATALVDGTVLFTGGFVEEGDYDRDLRSLDDAELYDPATGEFLLLQDHMKNRRTGHQAVPLADGSVLIVGGYDMKVTYEGDQPLVSTTWLADAEVWNPKTKIFESVGAMNSKRSEFTATTLLDGRVLIAGGTDGERTLETAELYDPKSRRFFPCGSMATPRQDHTATLLRDGRVFIIGGSFSGSAPDYKPEGDTAAEKFEDETVLDSVEVYDPSRGTFSSL
jgi:hypothetical protein